MFWHYQGRCVLCSSIHSSTKEPLFVHWQTGPSLKVLMSTCRHLNVASYIIYCFPHLIWKLAGQNLCPFSKECSIRKSLDADHIVWKLFQQKNLYGIYNIVSHYSVNIFLWQFPLNTSFISILMGLLFFFQFFLISHYSEAVKKKYLPHDWDNITLMISQYFICYSAGLF